MRTIPLAIMHFIIKINIIHGVLQMITLTQAKPIAAAFLSMHDISVDTAYTNERLMHNAHQTARQT